MSSKLAGVWMLSALAAATCVACAAKHHDTTQSDDSALIGEDGSDASEVESQTSSLTATYALLPQAATSPTAEDVVTNADNAKSFFLPQGCVTFTKDTTKHQVTYVYDACTGPWGLVRVTGTVVVTYTVTSTASGSVLTIDANGNGLRFNRATADYHASATVTATGLARDMKWNGSLSGTTARGRAFARSAQWDVKWTIGQSCIALDGTATGDVAARRLETKVSGYQRCRGECPQAGGDITITDVKNARSVDIKFDGSNAAVVTTSAGATYSITLACGL